MSNDNLVDFGDYTDEAAQEEAEDLAKSGGQFAKIPIGESQWRILPPPKGETSPFKTVYQHYIKLPGMEKGLTFACPRIHDRRHCPACAQANKLKGSTSKTDQRMARELQAGRRVMCNAIQRTSNGDVGPQILAFGKQIHEQLNNLRNSRQGGNFTHPIEGFDIVIQRKGQGMDTEYHVSAARDDSQLSESVEEMNDWISNQADLSSYALPPSEDELQEMMQQLPGAPTTGGGRSTRQLPAGGGGRSSRRRTAEDDAFNEEA